jgi:hypothetical protein
MSIAFCPVAFSLSWSALLMMTSDGHLTCTLRTRFSINCPQLATKCIELVGGRKVVGGHQLSTNVALSDLLSDHMPACMHADHDENTSEK